MGATHVTLVGVNKLLAVSGVDDYFVAFFFLLEIFKGLRGN
jgi:hypothetical protein